MLGCSSPVAATIAGRSGTWIKPTFGGFDRCRTEWRVV